MARVKPEAPRNVDENDLVARAKKYSFLLFSIAESSMILILL